MKSCPEPDNYPDNWNRVYEHGKLVRAFPPVLSDGIKFSENRMHDCGFFSAGSAPAYPIIDHEPNPCGPDYLRIPALILLGVALATLLMACLEAWVG